MSLEPAIALAIGAVALAQVPGALAVVGVVLVVAAGIGATRGGGRPERRHGTRPDAGRQENALDHPADHCR